MDAPIAGALRTTRAAAGPRGRRDSVGLRAPSGANAPHGGALHAWARALAGHTSRVLRYVAATTPSGSVFASVLPAASSIELDASLGHRARSVGIRTSCRFKVVVSTITAGSTQAVIASRCAARSLHKPPHYAPQQP